MSLSEVVLEIADQLEADAKMGASPDDLCFALMTGAKMLRMAVKASSVAKVGESRMSGPMIRIKEDTFDGSLDPGIIEATTIMANSQAKMELDAKLARTEEKDQVLGASMTECVDGSSDACMVPIPPNMPVGAKTLISGEVYAMGIDRKLHFQEESTRNFRDSQRKFSLT